jgi:hypothetical protein
MVSLAGDGFVGRGIEIERARRGTLEKADVCCGNEPESGLTAHGIEVYFGVKGPGVGPAGVGPLRGYGRPDHIGFVWVEHHPLTRRREDGDTRLFQSEKCEELDALAAILVLTTPNPCFVEIPELQELLGLHLSFSGGSGRSVWGSRWNLRFGMSSRKRTRSSGTTQRRSLTM